MFARLFSQESPTRFDTCSILQPIFSALSALRAKEKSLGLLHAQHILERAEKNNNEEDSVTIAPRSRREERDTFREKITDDKHTIVSTLLVSIDEYINEYNQATKRIHDADEMRDTLKLVNALKQLVSDARHFNFKKLNTTRNNNQSNVNNAVHYGVVGSATAAALFCPLTFAAGVLAIGTSTIASNATRDFIGLSDLRPETIKILDKLHSRLETVENSLLKCIDYCDSSPTPARR